MMQLTYVHCAIRGEDQITPAQIAALEAAGWTDDRFGGLVSPPAPSYDVALAQWCAATGISADPADWEYCECCGGSAHQFDVRRPRKGPP